MQLFDGLYLYEIILLVLGVAMFFVLLYFLASYLKNGKPVAGLLLFFAIPLVMIAYPSIQSFDISATEIKIQTASAQLEKDPTDKTARVALTSDVAAIANRPLSSPTVLTTLARAQLALGDTAAAQQNISKALQSAPSSAAAVKLNNRIDLENKLPALTQAVQADTNNAEAKTQLNNALTEVNSTPVVNPQALVNVAKAQSALGDNAKAQITADKALAIEPANVSALQLKKNIMAQHQ